MIQMASAKTGGASVDQDADRVDDLITSILKVPGKKIITLIGQESEPFVIDVSANGDLGYHESHGLLFKAKLGAAFRCAGGLIIRQFLPLKVQRARSNEKKLWIPRKNIYGIQILNGKWQPLSADELRLVHTTDAVTGQPLPQEEDVRFVEFPYSQAAGQS
jgi:hypothetical protein